MLLKKNLVLGHILNSNAKGTQKAGACENIVRYRNSKDIQKMKLKAGLILLTLMVLCSDNTLSASAIIDKAFLGSWTAYSKNYVSISGDMVVTQNTIEFNRRGKVKFQILKYDGKEYILKINKNVDSGYFMRLGPITSSKYFEGLEMEVAYYESKENALSKRNGKIGDASSWGIYVK